MSSNLQRRLLARQAETAAETEKRKLAELDRELLHRLILSARGPHPRMTDLFGQGFVPRWAGDALSRCIAAGLVEQTPDRLLVLTHAGRVAADQGRRECEAFAAREMFRGGEVKPAIVWGRG